MKCKVKLTRRQAMVISVSYILLFPIVGAILCVKEITDSDSISRVIAYGWIICLILCRILSKSDRKEFKEKQILQKAIKQKQYAEERAKEIEAKLREKERKERLERMVKEESLKDSTPIEVTFMFTTPKRDTYCKFFGLGKPVYQITTGHEATFRVKYASGRIGTETVDVDSSRFKELVVLSKN